MPPDRAASLVPWRLMFAAVAVYDLVLGFAFFWFHRPLFEALDTEVPVEPSYVHLLAAFVFVQGVAYVLVARKPLRNVDLVRVGVLYKLSYAGTAFYYAARGDVPHAVFVFFGVVDAVVLGAFVAYLWLLQRGAFGAYPRQA
jgi:hypothetical protein